METGKLKNCLIDLKIKQNRKNRYQLEIDSKQIKKVTRKVLKEIEIEKK